MVTCGLTACTPGSAPGPMLGIEYGKAFSLFYLLITIGEGNTRVAALTLMCCFSARKNLFLPDVRFKPV